MAAPESREAVSREKIFSTRRQDDTVSREEPAREEPLGKEARAASRLEAAQFPESLEEATVDDPKAWELIDPEEGRYMPRRIRGSFRGRALG
jgi:hypothetical protein